MKSADSNKPAVVTALAGVLGLLLWSGPSAAQDTQGATQLHAVHHDVSPPLAHMVPLKPAPGHRVKPLGRFPLPQAPAGQTDPVLQTTTTGLLVPVTVGQDLLGLGQHYPGFTVNGIPPDPNAAVGATQVVQWVNESFVVFDKSTGVALYGPAAGNTLWQGFAPTGVGALCGQDNDGDPIVQYDKLANRWVMTQFAVTGADGSAANPYLQCVAVSTTSDARGTWNRYAFAYNYFPDYPKLGVWPDAYYTTFNMFKPSFFGTSFSFVGARVCAYDRQSMLLGNPATQQCFQLGSSFAGLLPADLDGPTQAPPSGSPNFLLSLGVNALNFWKFHVDWSNTANTTLSGPASIPVAAFNQGCGGAACIPQSNTSQKLDSLGDRLMYRLAYRNFGAYESLVVNHTVQVGSARKGITGVRWYELRNPNGSPTVFQQGTYAPDSKFRWMASLAMDKVGNMAMGYSVSSGSMPPTLRYTGRLSTDAPNTMQAETTAINGNIYGSGSQTSYSRWGDYSSMSVDPVDGCTFWYTNEYLVATGNFNWDTRLFSFKFANCN
nr:hypothetical protein [uncultured Ralstonia sp.]